ncbi:MAG: hypothetical protein RRA92_06510 [Gemmatimonadota bacterium]|nr:hypothetical protein [Gemmatimonadota bacterium]
MHGNPGPGPEEQSFEVLRRLRRAERRVRAIRRRWRAFRDAPGAQRLGEVRRAVERAGAEIGRLEAALGSAPPGPPVSSGAFAAAGRPSPRALVEAGRALDGAVSEALRAWSETRTAPDAPGLGRLAEALARADAAADTLLGGLRALPGGAVEGAAPGDAAEGRPPRGAASVGDDAGSGAGDTASAPPPHPTLEGLLDGLRRDWERLRTAPSTGRARRLRDQVARAHRQAEALAALAAGDSPLAAPEALRYLAGAGETVRFPPFRDGSTGAFNARGFRATAGPALERCRRYGRPLGLLLIRLARPETQPGEATRPILGVLQGLLRTTDIVGRGEAEEIVIALPESGARATRRIAARLLRALDAAGRAPDVQALVYAVSPDDADSVDGLLREARARIRT